MFPLESTTMPLSGLQVGEHEDGKFTRVRSFQRPPDEGESWYTVPPPSVPPPAVTPYKFPAESKTTPDHGLRGPDPHNPNEKTVVKAHGPECVGESLKTYPP